jgi:sphingolipid 4-desaturase/C4-monooxygenase
MPASTSTVTTSAKTSSGATRLRVEPEAKSNAPRIDVNEHDFFWTYTEEPHRTRRQAIIKAHPEVDLPPSSLRPTN